MIRPGFFIAAIGCTLVAASCDQATEPPGVEEVEEVEPEVRITAINGNAVDSTTQSIAVEDSLAVVVRVSVPEGSESVQVVEVVQRLGAGTESTIARVETDIGPGTSADVDVVAYAPSGPFELFAQARTDRVHPSAAVAVELSRPRTWIRVLSINGEPVIDAGINAVEDSFRVAALLSVADTSPGIDAVSLRGMDPSWLFESIRTVVSEFAAGESHEIEFTGYVAPPGTYDVTLIAEAFPEADQWENWTYTRASHGPIHVDVTQSDLEPPTVAITHPEDGATVDTADISVTFEASDNRAIWYRRHGPVGCMGASSYGSPDPNGMSQITLEERICRLKEGENTIVVEVTDVALNTGGDTIVVVYDPGG